MYWKKHHACAPTDTTSSRGGHATGSARPPRTARRARTRARRAASSGLDGLLELGAGAEPRGPRRLDGHGLTCGGGDAPAGGAVGDRKLSEPGDTDLGARGERLLDGLQGRVEHAPRLGPGHSGTFG